MKRWAMSANVRPRAIMRSTPLSWLLVRFARWAARRRATRWAGVSFGLLVDWGDGVCCDMEGLEGGFWEKVDGLKRVFAEDLDGFGDDGGAVEVKRVKESEGGLRDMIVCLCWMVEDLVVV